MALGAGWAGARSMTATAGPGISLMSRIRRPGLLRRDSRGDLRRGARRPLHRPAHAHRSRATCSPPRCSPTATPSTPCSSRARREECFSHGHRGLRSRRAVPDAGLRHDRSRPRHEQLDGRSVRLSREADRPRQGADRRRSRTSWAASPATRTWMATASATARCPAPIIPQRPTSRAAAATTTRRSTPSAKTTTSTTWTAWRTSSKSCASTFPQPVVRNARRRQDRLRRLRHLRLRGARKLRSAASANTTSTPATCG